MLSALTLALAIVLPRTPPPPRTAPSALPPTLPARGEPQDPATTPPGTAFDPRLPDPARGRVEAAFLEVLVDGHHAGGAVFIGAPGLAATVAHSLGNPDSVREVIDTRGRRRAATLIAVHPGADLALLQIEGGEAEAHLEFRETPLAATESIHLLGTPLYRPPTWIPGQVAGLGPSYEWYPSMAHFVEIRTVAAITPPGTSGGPWVDGSGRLVGIQSGAMSRGSALQGLAFLAEVSGLVDLIEGERRTRGDRPGGAGSAGAAVYLAPTTTLGAAFEELWQHGSDTLGRFPRGSSGLLVRSPRTRGPLARAGLAELELIVAVEGRAVRRVADLLDSVRANVPGTPLRLAVMDEGSGELREALVESEALTSPLVPAKAPEPSKGSVPKR